MADALRGPDRPDPDLFEYVLVSAPDVEGLAPVAAAVIAMAHTGAVRVVDAVLLTRPDSDATVRMDSPGAHHALVELGRVLDGGPLLSPHDVELVALTLEPR